MSVWQFADHIAAVPPEHRITLGEGNTPLIRSRTIAPSLGVDRLYFKLETSNPTGSYKDRFAAVAISDMLAHGKTRCIATSSGNTGAALAAYCAVAHIACELAIVETAPSAKLLQMLAYGAQLKRIRGFGSDAEITRSTFTRLQQLGTDRSAALQISAFHYSPLGMSGVETISHEIYQQLSEEQTVDHVFVPAGGGGLALAVARGFERSKTLSSHSRFPAVHVVQPAGNDTIATPLRTGVDCAQNVTCTSAISGLQVPSVIDGDLVIAACRASGGTGHTISDEKVWHAQTQLARHEGIFAEPAAAVAFAGAMQAIERHEISRDATIVCLVTGCGFKDMISLNAMTKGHQVSLIDWNDL
jgi:threonine synthase